MTKKKEKNILEIAQNYLHSEDLEDIGDYQYDMSSVTLGEFWPMVRELLEQPPTDVLNSTMRYHILQETVRQFSGSDKILNRDELEIYRLYQEEILDFSQKILAYNFVSVVHEMIHSTDFSIYKNRQEYYESINPTDKEELEYTKKDMVAERERQINVYAKYMKTDSTGYKPSKESLTLIYDMCEELYRTNQEKSSIGKDDIISLLEESIRYDPNNSFEPQGNPLFSKIPIKDIFCMFESIYAVDRFPYKKGGHLFEKICEDTQNFLLGKSLLSEYVESSRVTESNKLDPFSARMIFSRPSVSVYQGVELANYNVSDLKILNKVIDSGVLSKFVNYKNRQPSIWSQREELYESLKNSSAFNNTLNYNGFKRGIAVISNNMGNLNGLFGKFQTNNSELMQKLSKFYPETLSLDLNCALEGVRDEVGHLRYIMSDYRGTSNLANILLNNEIKEGSPSIAVSPPSVSLNVEYYSLDNIPKQSILGDKAQGLVNLKNNNYPVAEGIVFPVENSYLYQSNKAAWLKSLRPALSEISKNFKDSNGHPALWSVSQSPVNGGTGSSILNVGIDSSNYDYLCKEMGEKVVNECVNNFMKTFCHTSFNEKIEFSSNLPKALFQFRRVLNRHGVAQDFDNNFPLNSRQQYRLSLDGVLKFDYGVGIIVQKMVYGNRNELSGTGQYTSRAQGSGKTGMQGMFNSQSQTRENKSFEMIESLKTTMPGVFAQLEKMAGEFEIREQCIQKIDFVVDNGQVYFTHRENVVMEPLAQCNLNLDLYQKGLIDKDQLLNSLNVAAFDGRHMKKEREELGNQVLALFNVQDKLDKDTFLQAKELITPQNMWFSELPSAKRVCDNGLIWESTLGLNNKVAMMLVLDYKQENPTKVVSNVEDLVSAPTKKSWYKFLSIHGQIEVMPNIRKKRAEIPF